MTTALALFQAITTAIEEKHRHIQRGYLLSAPALEYKGRAFAFYRDGEIVVKLGNLNPADYGIRGYRTFQPFPSGITLSNWVQIPFYYYSSWTRIAELALDNIREELD